MENEQKPDWITDRQWAANPNVYHWEQSLQVNKSQAQSKKPLTRARLEEQMRKRMISLGQTPQDYDNFLNEQKQVDQK